MNTNQVGSPLRGLCVFVAALFLVGCPAMVTVPFMQGLTQSAAQTAITGASLTVGSVTQEFSTTVAAGQVISQAPAGGVSVEEGSAVSLVISLGVQPVTVPSVVGATQSNAQATLTAAGLTVEVVTQAFSNTMPVGRVISQNPAGNASAAPGTAVSLVVSLGLQPVIVPNVVGATQVNAEASLAAAGLTTGTITTQFSASVAAGLVISQNPAGNTSVAPGSLVSLVISLGTQPGTVPGVVGASQFDASIAITTAGYTVGAVTQENSASVPVGNVISQSPSAGTPATAGTAVSLVISLGPEGGAVPDVTGLTQAAAEDAIESAGLSVGSVTLQFSTTVPEGEVISQTPSADTLVSDGSSVDLVVSSGSDCVFVPEVTRITEAAAATALQAEGLVLGTVTQAFSTTVPTGLISGQSLAEGTCVSTGMAVNLTLSMGASLIAINDIDELQKIGNDPAYPLNGNYVLANAINASATATWNGGLGFSPIGSAAAPFNGWFDGAGFAITNLFINRPDEDNVGLFSRLGVFESLNEEARVSNVTLVGGSIAGRDFVGSVCGYGGNGLLGDCESSAEVSGRDTVGGMAGFLGTMMSNGSASGDVTASAGGSGGYVGSASSSFITASTASGNVTGVLGVGGFAGGNTGLLSGCTASGNVSGSSRYVGGLIGSNGDSGSDAIVVNCHASGDVTAGFEVGGLIGRNYLATSVSRCSASGNVTCTAFGGAGGLIGFNYSSLVGECFAEGSVNNTSPWAGSGGLIGISGASTIANCYALGAVSGADRVGGLIGDATWAEGGGNVVHCYAVGAISSPSDKGGLIGVVNPFASPVVTGSFWDTTTTGLDTTSGGGSGLPTAQLQMIATFTNAGWDFTTTWDIEEGIGYPFLQSVP